MVPAPENLAPHKAKSQGHKKQKRKTVDREPQTSSSKKVKMETFGERFEEDWPLDSKPFDLEFKVQDVKKNKFVSLDEIIEKSSNFPIPFPIETGRCHYLKQMISKEELERNINSTYPILHERVLKLYENFLMYKREYGSQLEKDLYRDMNVPQLIDRFLKNRAVNFWAANDKWQLLSKETGISGWDTIGTEKEKKPLLLNNVISYDEIKLSAFLYVSGYTYLVNNGKRNNCGVSENDRSLIENEAVIIGLIGARLKRKHVMEYEEIIITKEQNNSQNGYADNPNEDNMAKQKWRKLWADFYDENINTYTEVQKEVQNGNPTYFPARAKNAYFDNMYYKKRITLAIDALIFEANDRSLKAGKMGYIHVVGIGLGVWRNAEHQEPLFLDLFLQRLKFLKESTRNISDIHFAYFKCGATDKVRDGMETVDTEHPKGGIKIYISKREPGDKLEGVHEGKLLVLTYAWDGNALPGNEYWCKMLKSSGDSAAASSTQVAELHNPHINENVCADNLYIASKKYGVISYSQYLELVKQ